MKRKVNDFILDFLVAQGIHDVFVLTGGAIAFVIDAFHGRKDIRYVCAQHEQAGAMMAEAYSRVGPGYGAAMATSGPGATNLITGICCAWFDSIPALYITGQVNTFESKGNFKVRQIGFQETEIVNIVKPITKYAVQIQDEKDIRYELEKATYIAKSGRPGPVLIDIPMNFQRAIIDTTKLHGFKKPKNKEYADTDIKLKNKINRIVKLIQKAKRPVLLAGGGIKGAKGGDLMRELVNYLQYPTVSSWSGYDIIPKDTKYFIGGIGVYGERAANFTVQNSDLLITVGSRLDTRQTGGKPDTFARESKVIMVDIDKGELNKRRGFTPYLSVNTDAKEFLEEFLKVVKKEDFPKNEEWLKTAREWVKKYPTVDPGYYKETKEVNAYAFVETLSEQVKPHSIIVADTGGHLTWTMQAWKTKKGQNIFSAFGNSPMGYAFPAALGASIALKKKEVICITGDGSMQINIQELQTMKHENLPVKVFVFNNNGYGIIKQFQELYLDSHYEATGKGYSVPDIAAISEAYGIKSISIKNHKEMPKKIKEALDYKGPVVVEVHINPAQKLIPKLAFGRPIEDLSPVLPRKEFLKEMIVKPLPEPKQTSGTKVNEIN